jgi:hypothetical protein
MADDADLFCLSTRRSSCSSPRDWKAILAVLAVAAAALAGCNASQGVNVSAQTAPGPGVAPGPYFPNYNPYDPVHYAQTSGFYSGH